MPVIHDPAGPDRDRLHREAVERFEERFGVQPQWVARAPGRVNLIGEHTDYNDGYVLPLAIDRYVVIAAARASDETIFHSADLGETASIRTQPPITPGPRSWSSYVQGVVAGFAELRIDVPPLVAVIRSSVPLGGGLSSSAALEVATATVLEAATGVTLDPVRKALLCQQAEHQFAGVPCGIMDQFSSVLGQQDHLMLLDCRNHRVEMIPFQDPALTLLVCNSNVHHELASSEYARRRQECRRAAALLGLRSLRDATLPMLKPAHWELDEICCRRARHVISENERTRAAATAVSSGQWEQAGRLMLASHASLRDDYAVSCRELDLLVQIADAIGPEGGVLGARMTGGGFGGCTVNLVRSDRLAAVSQQLSRQYEDQTGIRPGLFATRPAAGAGRLDLAGDRVAGMAEGSGGD